MSHVRKRLFHPSRALISLSSYPQTLDSLHIPSSLLSVHLRKHTKGFLRPWQNMTLIYGKLRIYYFIGYLCGSTVVKVLCYKSEGRWFDPSCQWIFH